MFKTFKVFKRYNNSDKTTIFINRGEIVIPIANDPSGDVMFFNVKLIEAQNGAKIGPMKNTQIMIDHVEGLFILTTLEQNVKVT